MGGTFCLYLTCYVPPAGIKPFIKELIGGTPRCLFERNVPPKRRNCFQEGILVVHSRLKQESLYHRHKEEPWRGQWGRRNVQQAGWRTPQVRRSGCQCPGSRTVHCTRLRRTVCAGARKAFRKGAEGLCQVMRLLDNYRRELCPNFSFR